MGIDDDLKPTDAFNPIEEVFNDNDAFDTWAERFIAQMDTIPSVQAQELKTYAFICQKEMPLNSLDEVTNTAVKTICNNTIRYCVWNGRVYSPFEAEEGSALPDFKLLLTEVYSSTLYHRIQFYLLDNGYIMCSRCGAIYKVIY